GDRREAGPAGGAPRGESRIGCVAPDGYHRGAGRDHRDAGLRWHLRAADDPEDALLFPEVSPGEWRADVGEGDVEVAARAGEVADPPTGGLCVGAPDPGPEHGVEGVLPRCDAEVPVGAAGWVFLRDQHDAGVPVQWSSGEVCVDALLQAG